MLSAEILIISQEKTFITDIKAMTVNVCIRNSLRIILMNAECFFIYHLSCQKSSHTCYLQCTCSIPDVLILPNSTAVHS